MKTCLALVLLAITCFAQNPAFSGGPALDALIEQAIADQLIPGAVLVVGHNGQTVYRKVYGSRALVPVREPMTEDTVFDAASLTKVVATTAAMMKLVETGKVRVNDRVTVYLPEFQGGASDITVRDLLTHFSGLRPDVDLKPVWSGYDTGVRLALIDKPAAPPGVRFVYSDINFVLLGEIVRRAGGAPLPEYVTQNVWGPLGMRETMFNPPPSLRARIAPTEVEEGTLVHGVVHDPTARFMGGVAGHAGMFTTAADLAKFAEMMLGFGERGGVRVFSPLTVRKFTTPQSPANQPILRGFGWDMDSPFSSNRGDLFPIGSYGHTGFTGTSMWIDPVTRSYVILLANSVHPSRGKNLSPLRNKVATVTAAALGIDAPGLALTGYNETLTGPGLRRTVARNSPVMTGLDVLAAAGFASLQGKRVGLFTNHTGISRDGKRNIDLMRAAGVNVTVIFSPEHGIAGKEDHENVGDATDAATGIPVISLYQAERRRPTPEMLSRIDTLVFDIQDVGARFYTYSCSLLYSMEETAKARREYVVLDRPNPITGVKVEGLPLDADLHSFVGCIDMPLRHGMTFGELARMINAERKLGLDLKVVAARNWLRGDWWDSTGLPWVDPSPNMRNLTAAVLYPGVAMLEYSKNYSVGRGTDAPFEQVGADWMDGKAVADFLNRRFIPGIRVYPARLRPTASNFAGMTIDGVRFVLTDREAFNSVRFGLELAYALGKLYPGRIDPQVNQKLVGNRELLEMLKRNEDPRTWNARLQQEAERFVERRKPFLLY